MKISLKLIKTKLQSISYKLKWEMVNVQSGSAYKITGLKGLREFIQVIDSLGLFNSIVIELKKSAIYTTADDIIRVKQVEALRLDQNLIHLKELTESFIDVLLKIVPEEDIDSINIKLPEVNDFDELSKITRSIHVALSQVIINDEINGQTKIVSVENGSIWFNVIVGTSAVFVVASIAWSAAVIYKKIQEGKLLEQQVRGLKVKNDSLEDILKAQKAETDLMIQAEAEHVYSEHFKENQPENIERIKNSISTFSDLIGKGAEIQPALVAPEEVANLFPDPTKLISLESKVKKLTDSSMN